MVQDRLQCWLESSGFPQQKPPHHGERREGFSKPHDFHLGGEEWQPGQHEIVDPLASLEVKELGKSCENIRR